MTSMTSTRQTRLVLAGLLLGIMGTLYPQSLSLRPLAETCGVTTVPGTTAIFGNGAAAADFDNDGDIDFYLTTDAGSTDRLYQNDGSGYFTDVALLAGIEDRAANRAGLWFDFNGDQLLDLVVAGENCPGLICDDPVRLTLYRQSADFTLEEVTVAAGLQLGDDFDYLLHYGIGGLTAGDLNGDEYLDLILTIWGGGIKYFQNNTDGTFTDLTTEAGFLLEDPTPWQAMLHDFNGDGLLDVFCNVDFAPNKLWINQGGVFIDQAAAYGLDSDFNEMGMAISDVDNDGDLDIYLTNITRNFRGVSQHNVLFERTSSNGVPVFKETGTGRGVSQSGWDWGTTFTDINNDGRQDLLTTNGWWDARAYSSDPSKLWLNTTAGFLDFSATSGFNDAYHAATLLAFDKDRDGDMDILQTLKDNPDTELPLLIYENGLTSATEAGINYVNVQPRMAGANHFAIGAKVTVFADGLTSSRLISAGCSFYGQEPAEAFFGIGARTDIREVRVDWPGGKTTLYRDLPVNQVVQLDYEHIAAPTELAATADNAGILLRWRDHADNESRFELQQSSDANFTTFTTTTLSTDATSHQLPTPPAGSTTYYRVNAANERVASGYSNLAEFSVPVPPVISPTIAFTCQNPVTGQRLVLNATIPESGPVILTFHDLAGRRLWQTEELLPAATSVVTYPLEFPPGAYVLRICYDGQETSRKILLTGG